MKFEVGKYYKHTGGRMLHIVGGLQTTRYGGCLVAEQSNSTYLMAIAQDEGAAINWEETTEYEWMKNFS